MDGLTYTFDWQAEAEGTFAKWLLPLVVPADKDKFEELSEATDKWRNVELGITVNGVSLPVEHFLDCLKANYEAETIKQAKKMTNELFGSLREEIDEAEQAARNALRERLKAAGVEYDWYETDSE